MPLREPKLLKLAVRLFMAHECSEGAGNFGVCGAAFVCDTLVTGTAHFSGPRMNNIWGRLGGLFWRSTSLPGFGSSLFASTDMVHIPAPMCPWS